jgi:hypothetical protein
MQPQDLDGTLQGHNFVTLAQPAAVGLVTFAGSVVTYIGRYAGQMRFF